MALGGVKSFFVNLGIEAATGMVRGWLTEQLKDKTPSDLYESIIDNRDLWSITTEEMKTTSLKFKGTFADIFKKYEDRITTELIMEWLQKDRPDLHSTIINTYPDNPIGVQWLDLQVRKIKQKIIEM